VDEKPWFHGSPYQIEILRAGSTITRDEALARAFSHKPAILCIDDDGPGGRRIQHNGVQPGLLYVIDEVVGDEDVYPHPNSSMLPGYEWLTRRPLRLRLVGPVEIQPGDWLSEEEVEELRQQQMKGAGARGAAGGE
jgi:hypothetical protein